MVTIYYPHLDLETKGLLANNINHVLNIKLLLLLADRVLLLPSHLVYTEFAKLQSLKKYLIDFFESGKIVTSIHLGQNTLNDHYAEKIHLAQSKQEQNRLVILSEFILSELFSESPPLIKRDNNQEICRFQIVFNDINKNSIIGTKNTRLIRSVELFETAFFNKSESCETFLTIQDVENLYNELFTIGKIPRSHVDFLRKNMIGAYYYCGSLANHAITAYNPYFVGIQFDVISNDIPFRSNNAYNPDFLLDILLGLDVISCPDELLQLTSLDYDHIKQHTAWREFLSLFSHLYDHAFLLSSLISQEQNKQKRIDKIKTVLYNLLYGMSDMAFSTIIGLVLNGWIGVALGLILMTEGVFFNESKFGKRAQFITVDKFVDKIIAAREPLYVMTSRLKQRIKGIL